MSSRVLVLGAAGRLGHTAAEAFRDAGWTVTSLVRPGAAARAPAGTEPIEVDALDHAAVSAAARGADVILHALNPLYTGLVAACVAARLFRHHRRRDGRRHADVSRQSLQLRLAACRR